MISEAENIEHASNFRGSRMEFDFRGRHKSHDGSTFSTDVSDEEGKSSNRLAHNIFLVKYSTATTSTVMLTNLIVS